MLDQARLSIVRHRVATLRTLWVPGARCVTRSADEAGSVFKGRVNRPGPVHA